MSFLLQRNFLLHDESPDIVAIIAVILVASYQSCLIMHVCGAAVGAG